MTLVKKYGPGLGLCLALAVPSWLLGKAFPVVGGPVFAILLGMAVALFYKKKDRTQAGVAFTSKKVLQYAVILLGFGLNLSQIAQVGAQSLPIIVLSLIHISRPRSSWSRSPGAWMSRWPRGARTSPAASGSG